MDPKPETHVWWVGTEVHSEDLRTNLNLTVLASPPAAQTMSRWKNSNLISSVCQQMEDLFLGSADWKCAVNFERRRPLPPSAAVRTICTLYTRNKQTNWDAIWYFQQFSRFRRFLDLFCFWFIVSLWKYEKYQNTLKFCWRTSPSVNWRWKQSWVFCRSAAH